MTKSKKPASFDCNLVVIGAGSAGLVASYIAAAVKAKVMLIEKHRMGGDCLNTGCVPSKALIRSARFLAQMHRAKDFGFKNASVQFELSDIMDRVQKVIQSIAPHDSVQRYRALGVECVQGEARITSPWTVEVGGRTIRAQAIIVATGGRPAVPDLPGLEQSGYVTSDTIWQLRALPQRLLVIGGGPIGCELAQCFARFGSRVSLVHRGDRIMEREDPDVSTMVQERFGTEGIDLKLRRQAVAFRFENGEKILDCLHHGQKTALPYDAVLLALGRRAQVRGFGLEELGVQLTERGTVAVNPYLQTNIPSIYAIGDVAGPYQFTHTASHMAWYATVNALFGMFRKYKVDYSVIPWATFTDPEVARVGISEQEAQARGTPYEVSRYGLDDLDRAIADGEAHGMVKVLTVPGKDKILGATIVGDHAADIIPEFVAAMRHGFGMNKILGTVHIYPTFAEANKYAAGVWKRARAPAGILKWVERFHRWRLG